MNSPEADPGTVGGATFGGASYEEGRVAPPEARPDYAEPVYVTRPSTRARCYIEDYGQLLKELHPTIENGQALVLKPGEGESAKLRAHRIRQIIRIKVRDEHLSFRYRIIQGTIYAWLEPRT